MSEALADLGIATRLVADDPSGFGGLWLRGADEEVRDAVLAILRERHKPKAKP